MDHDKALAEGGLRDNATVRHWIQCGVPIDVWSLKWGDPGWCRSGVVIPVWDLCWGAHTRQWFLTDHKIIAALWAAENQESEDDG